MTMNRTHNHYYFPEKHTNLEHQVLIFYHISLYVQERLQRDHFLTHQKVNSKTMSLDT